MARRALLLALVLFLSCGDPASPDAERSDFALRFDGVDDIACMNSLGVLPVPTVTAAAWVRPDSIAHTRLLLSREDASDGRGFFVGIVDGRWMAGGSAGTGTFMAAFDTARAGTWTHVAFTFEVGSSRITAFVNGHPVGSVTGASFALNTGAINSTAMGRHVFSVRDAFSGSVDDLAIWGRALDSTEVNRVIVANPLAVPDGLFSWNPFSEGSGIYARDSVNAAAWAYLGRGSAAHVPVWVKGNSRQYAGTSRLLAGRDPMTRSSDLSP